MVDPVTMFKDGGPFMYLLLLMGGFGPMAAIFSGALAAARFRVPAVVWVLGTTLIVGTGLLGSYFGAMLALEAVAFASVEMQQKMAANGLSVALYTLVGGGALGALVAASFAFCHGAGTAFGAKDSELTVAHAVPGLVVAVLCLPLLVVGSWLGAGVALVGGLGMAISAIRIPVEEAKRGTTVSGRVFTGAMTGLGALFALLSMVSSAAALYYFASATASAETQQAMMSDASNVLLPVGGLVALVLATLVATLAAVAPVAKSVLDTRSIGSAVVASFPAGMLLFFMVPFQMNVSELMVKAEDPQIALTALVEETGVTLPRATQGRMVLAGARLEVVAGRMSLDGAPLGPAVEIPRSTTIVTDGASDLRWLAAVAPRMIHEVYWLADGPHSLVSFRLSVAQIPPSPMDDELEIIKRSADVAVVSVKNGVRRRLGEPGSKVEELLSGVAVGRRGVSRIQVWLPPDATSQDLVDLVSRFEGSVEWVLRVDTPPQVPVPVSTETVPVDSAVGQTGAGTLDQALIKGVIKRHMNQVRYCYQRTLVKNPELAGKIVTEFVIAPDGAVSSAKTRSSTMNSNEVENCITGRFMRMKFPAPTGGSVAVSYPFIFEPG